MVRATWSVFFCTLVLACQPAAPRPAGPAGCWHESKGICQEWARPTPELEATCRATDGEWVFPTCLTLDAIATCTASVRDTQVFYAAKLTPQQAQADCATRPGFVFATGNERAVVK